MSRKPRRTGRGARRYDSPLAVYIVESRQIGLSLALVVPLLLLYEVTMALLDAPLRNGAEVVVSDLFGQLPSHAVDGIRRGLLVLIVGACLLWLRREPPAVARAHWILVEALVLALALGPLVGWMVGGVGLSVEAPVSADAPQAWLPFLLSVGAGLWEEIVFRLLLLGGLAYVVGRWTPVSRPAALAIAVIVSALVFAFYHHAGAMGEPFEPARFAYRTVAGTILGVLFAYRGLAVVVYMHVFYDLLCDLRVLLG